MTFLVQTGIALVQIVLGFYGFWLIWRVLLPVLPGPDDPDGRIAPFARYFTDPLVGPIVRRTRLGEWGVSLCLLVIVAALQVGLARLFAHFG